MAHKGGVQRDRRMLLGASPQVLALVGGLGVVLSALAFFGSRHWEDTDSAARFERAASNRVLALQAALSHIEDDVGGLATFASEAEPDADRFRRRALQIVQRHDDTLALQWVPRVAAADRASFEAAASLALGAPFEITERSASGALVRAGLRDEYFPVLLVEPFAGNERARGFDLGSDPSLRAALQRARDSGLLSVSNRVLLPQDDSRFGLLVAHAVTRRGDAPTAVAGFAVGSYRLADLVQRSLQRVPTEPIDVELVDTSAAPELALLAWYAHGGTVSQVRPPHASDDATPYLDSDLRLGDRSWLVRCWAPPGGSPHSWRSWGILATGLLITLLLVDLLALYTGRSALRESERRFREVLDRLSLVALVIDERGHVTYCNDALLALVGFRRRELEGRDFFETCVGHDVREAARARALAQIRDERPAGYEELEIERRDSLGLRRLVGWTTTVLRDVVGRPTALVAVGSDITDRRRDEAERSRMQERLVLSDRLASVGTLAAGAAHEINNPLTFVSANLEYALETLQRARLGQRADLTEAETALRDALEGAGRVRNIVRDLKTFARSGDETTGPVDLVRVLELSLTMAGNEIRHRATLVRDLREVPPVAASESRLGQVFVNLLMNAAQAIPDGRADTNEIRVATRVGPDGRVLVEVTDTGGGMTPDIRGRIFEPFFTTRRIGEGMGLGLAICHRIVSGLGGEIEVESAPGRGSTFRVLLPAFRGTGRADATPLPPVLHRRIHVLVVDDEAAVCRSLARLLSPDHEVDIAISAREALAQINAGTTFDVILCDVMMPEFTGMDLRDAVARLSPALVERMVFLTGGAFTDRAQEFLASLPTPALEKPVDPAILRETIRRVAGTGPVGVQNAKARAG